MRKLIIIAAALAAFSTTASARGNDWKLNGKGSGNTVHRIAPALKVTNNGGQLTRWDRHPSSSRPAASGRSMTAGRNMSAMGMGARAGRAPGGYNTRPAALERK